MIPCVYVHGFMGGGAQWDDQLTATPPHHCVVLDLPGFGKNADIAPLNSIESYANWALDALDQCGISRFHLLGHSMGGMITQEMVARAPERVEKLILYGTGAQGVLPGRFETIETSKQRAITDGAEKTARRIAATWFLEREHAPAYEPCATIAARSSIEAIMAGLEAMNSWNGTSRLQKLDKTTLVIWGDKDRTYTWEQTEYLWRTIGGASLAVIPNSAHASHLEKTALFNMIVGEFLEN